MQTVLLLVVVMTLTMLVPVALMLRTPNHGDVPRSISVIHHRQLSSPR